VAECDEDVRERSVAVELEAPVDRADALDTTGAKARLPSAACPHQVGVREEVLHRGVVAVCDRSHERRGRAAADGFTHGEAREGRRREVAV